MTTNPEQPVLDAIAELVDWQLEEGRRRGDGPASTFNPPPATGSPGGIYGMARYGTDWRQVAPVGGVLTVPGDADDFFIIGAGGGGDGGFRGVATGGPGPQSFTARADSRSAPGIDSINPANGEQPRH